MTQYGRPSEDISVGNWEDEAASATSIYTSIDETTANDTDYIVTETGPASSVYVTKLSSLEDPSACTAHTVKYRYKKNASSGCQIDFTFQLRQGYTNEGSQGILLASAFHSNVASSWTTASYGLSASEANDISDYTSLYFRMYGDQV